MQFEIWSNHLLGGFKLLENGARDCHYVLVPSTSVRNNNLNENVINDWEMIKESILSMFKATLESISGICGCTSTDTCCGDDFLRVSWHAYLMPGQ